MKPAPFAYAAPRSLGEALRLLDGEEDAVALAGGQSLVPMLNFRLARPGLLVDLNPLVELEYLDVADGGTLRIGALARQITLERLPAVARGWPLLVEAVRQIAHPAIRSRGTVGGSLAHADSRSELPAALLALDARLRLVSLAGERWLPASEFFLSPMRTALGAGELLAEIEVPSAPEGARMAFLEHARTHGDYAIAGVATVIVPGSHAAIALIGSGPVQMRVPAAERALQRGAPASEVGLLAAEEVRDEYRRALIATLVARAIQAAS